MKRTAHWGLRHPTSKEEENETTLHFLLEAERIDSRILTRKLYQEFLKERHIESVHDRKKSKQKEKPTCK